jgi:NADPH-dependent F420 reductase
MSMERVTLIGGTGDLGFGLAVRWAMAGVSVVIGSRDASKAQQAVDRVRKAVREAGGAPGELAGFENTEAAAQGSVVVLAVPFAVQTATLEQIRGALKDCIFVDTTVPLATAVGGRPTRLLGVWQGSSAEQAREVIPEAVSVVSAFHNLSAHALEELGTALDADVLLCGDDAGAKRRLTALVNRIAGLRAVDAGRLEMSRSVEAITSLLISINKQNQVAHAGIRITGLPG